jgi:hypothetical protein
MDINATVTQTPAKRVNFDPTINLGHILTAITFLMAGFGAYNTLDNRITKQEQALEGMAQQRVEQAADNKERLAEIKADIKDLARLMADLARIQNQKPLPTR